MIRADIIPLNLETRFFLVPFGQNRDGIRIDAVVCHVAASDEGDDSLAEFAWDVCSSEAKLGLLWQIASSV